ncbi:MAG TPA: PP2C family protein-serine/threonine phosphatase [Geobacteraceae bacterium]
MTEPAHGSKGLHIDRFELKLAREVERLLFPKGSPDCTWHCIGVKNRMAGVLGGDYFDFMSLPDAGQVIFIGDVTGHGLHASVVMSLIYGFIHRAVIGAVDLRELVTQVNDFLLHFSERSQTIDQYFSSTLFIGVINPKTLAMEYVNAGHVPALIRRGGAVFELAPTTQPLGYFKKADIDGGLFLLAKGDRLLLYTDGIIETADASGERFGLERLKRLLSKNQSGHLGFLDRLFDTLRGFGIVDPPADDCSALVLDIQERAG